MSKVKTSFDAKGNKEKSNKPHHGLYKKKLYILYLLDSTENPLYDIIYQASTIWEVSVLYQYLTDYSQTI